jgi:hypothetical protein
MAEAGAQIVTLANNASPSLRLAAAQSKRSRTIVLDQGRPSEGLAQRLLDTAGAACAQGSRVPARPRRPRRGGRSDHVMGLESFSVPTEALGSCFDAFSSREAVPTPLSKCGAGFRSKCETANIRGRLR